MDKLYTKKDLEEAYKRGWRADKSYQSGKESFKEWFEIFSKPKKMYTKK